MCRRLVARGVVGCAIDLDQQKSRRIIVLLYDIEPHDAGLPNTVASVLECGRREGVDGVGLHVDEDMNDEH